MHSTDKSRREKFAKKKAVDTIRSTQKAHVSTHRQNKETTAKYSYILVTTNNNYPFTCCFSTLEHVPHYKAKNQKHSQNKLAHKHYSMETAQCTDKERGYNMESSALTSMESSTRH